MKIQNKSILQHHLERASKSKKIDKWIVATTHEEGVEAICQIASNLSIEFFKGSLNDVLDRFYNAIGNENPNYVVRITSDCPLVDPELIDKVVEYALVKNLSYSMTSESYPDGVDVEVFKFSWLKRAYNHAKLDSDREHVTPYIRRSLEGSIQSKTYPYETDYSGIRLTIDEKEDFKAIESLISNLGADRGWKEYANFIEKNPTLFKNQKIIRNSGYLKSLSNDKST
jgi:spore coat polysaccharide biosynthesis protein SpsF (cytidylyltransferase family)